MHRSTLMPVLFFDFDNTLTDGDILDQVIEEFSPNEKWRDWEFSWECGRLPARDCLRLQVENLQVTREELFARLSRVRVDPAFSSILAWARGRGVDVNIVSDSFVPMIRHVLSVNGIDAVPVFANDLDFAGNRLIPAFPHYDPACGRSANAKARHLVPYRHNQIVFAGDGHSDLDAALGADVVFAKSTLARELAALSVPFRQFDTLAPVLKYLQSEFAQRHLGRLRLA